METGWYVSYAQWVNSVPPYVRKLHFMYEAIRTSGKCRWNIYRTSSKCRWSIYRKSRKRRGTLRIVHKVERSSPTVIWNGLVPSMDQCWLSSMTPRGVIRANELIFIFIVKTTWGHDDIECPIFVQDITDSSQPAKRVLTIARSFCCSASFEGRVDFLYNKF